MDTRSRRAKLAYLVAAAFGAWALFAPAAALAFTPGQNGHPTSGDLTDLKGRASNVTLTFETNNAIQCSNGAPTKFTFTLDYSISGAALPAGATVVVYLSPNNGAIQNNSGGNDAAYIAAVESNEASLDFSGLSGSGSIDGSVTVTTPFALTGGGVLVVIANDKDGTSWTTKTLSKNCSEAPTPEPTATPQATATPEVTATPAATATPVVTATPAATATPGGGGGGAGGGPTPTPTKPPTSVAEQPMSGNSGGTVLAIILLAAAGLGFLATSRVRIPKIR